MKTPESQLQEIRREIQANRVAKHGCDEIDLRTTEALHQRITLIEKVLGHLAPEAMEGAEDLAQAFKDKIAKIESHHEKVGALLANVDRLLDETDGE